MNDAQKRDAIARAFPGEKWSAKVKKMSDSQVTATYLRLKNQGKV